MDGGGEAGRRWACGLHPGRHQEEGAAEVEMVGWHHRRNGHEFEQAPGAGDGRGGLACCGPWGHEESATTERWNGIPV